MDEIETHVELSACERLSQEFPDDVDRIIGDITESVLGMMGRKGPRQLEVIAYGLADPDTEDFKGVLASVTVHPENRFALIADEEYSLVFLDNLDEAGEEVAEILQVELDGEPGHFAKEIKWINVSNDQPLTDEGVFRTWLADHEYRHFKKVEEGKYDEEHDEHYKEHQQMVAEIALEAFRQEVAASKATKAAA